MSKRSTKQASKAPKTSAKIRFETSGRNLTSQAGLIPVIKFLDALAFNDLFARHVHHERRHNAQYQRAPHRSESAAHQAPRPAPASEGLGGMVGAQPASLNAPR